MKKSTASREQSSGSTPEPSQPGHADMGAQHSETSGEVFAGEFEPSELDAALGGDEYEDESYGDYADDHDDSHDDYDNAHDSSPAAHSSSGLATVALATGAVIHVTGLGLAAVWNLDAAQSARELLSGFGIGPMDITIVGLVLAGIAILRRSQRHQEAEIAAAVDAATNSAALSEELHGKLQEIAKSSSASSASNAPAGLHQVLHLIKRQEEKINNLSKATKMYGKPLLEITNQISESGHQIGEMISTVNAVKIIVEQSTSRLESTLRSELRKPEAAEHEMKEAIRATREAVGRLETLQRDLSQGLASSTDKISNEVRETTRDAKKDYDDLKGELSRSVAENTAKLVAENIAKLTEEMAQLDQHVEHARASVVEGMKSLSERQETAGAASAAAPSVDTSGLAATLAKIQKELSGLTGEIAGLKAAAPTGGGGSGGDKPAAQGKDKSPKGGKSVQSAIEKLKQMRS